MGTDRYCKHGKPELFCDKCDQSSIVSAGCGTPISGKSGLATGYECQRYYDQVYLLVKNRERL